MKKILALALALCMVFALAACGSSSAKSLTFTTGGEAGTYYAFGGVMAQTRPARLSVRPMVWTSPTSSPLPTPMRTVSP